MADKVICNKSDLVNIANSVRTKLGVTNPYYVSDLSGAIDSISAGSTPTLQEKTVTPSTSMQSITADNGYDGLSKVTVNAMPTATQATPSINVSSAGVITTSATQSAGYVAAGTKSATKQLTTQAAKTITPSTANQTAVASGRYTTDAVTVKGDANLVAGNIKSGTTIFGVTGTYEGSGGGTQSYTITSNSVAISFPQTATAGQLIALNYIEPINTISIVTDSGFSIPYNNVRSGRKYTLSFVMPASNVNISITV